MRAGLGHCVLQPFAFQHRPAKCRTGCPTPGTTRPETDRISDTGGCRRQCSTVGTVGRRFSGGITFCGQWKRVAFGLSVPNTIPSSLSPSFSNYINTIPSLSPSSSIKLYQYYTFSLSPSFSITDVATHFLPPTPLFYFFFVLLFTCSLLLILSFKNLKISTIARTLMKLSHNKYFCRNRETCRVMLCLPLNKILGKSSMYTCIAINKR